MYAVTRPARVAGVIALASLIAFASPPADAAERSAAKTVAAHAAKADASPAAPSRGAAAKPGRSAAAAAPATRSTARHGAARRSASRHAPTERSRVSSRRAPQKAAASRSSSHRSGRSAGRRSGGGGSASWYGPGFHGKRTASGQSFNQNALTAAHRSLPFGTKVKVTNRANGKSVVVTINDRGPFHGGRVIDLSRGAASRLGMMASGTASVILEVQARG